MVREELSGLRDETLSCHVSPYGGRLFSEPAGGLALLRGGDSGRRWLRGSRMANRGILWLGSSWGLTWHLSSESGVRRTHALSLGGFGCTAGIN